MVKYIKRHLVCQEDSMEEDNNTKHPCLEWNKSFSADRNSASWKSAR